MASGSELDNFQNLSPTGFEHRIAELWAAQGYETTVTQQSQDGGIDVLAHDPSTDKMVAIQAKRYQDGNNVSVGTVRKQASIPQRDTDIDRVAIVTTSNFTRQAKREAQKYPRVDLYTGTDIAAMADVYESTATRTQTQAAIDTPSPARINAIRITGIVETAINLTVLVLFGYVVALVGTELLLAIVELGDGVAPTVFVGPLRWLNDLLWGVLELL